MSNKKSIIQRNGVLLEYFNASYIYDYAYGDSSHTGNLTNKLLVSQKYDYIMDIYYSNQMSMNFSINESNNLMVIVVVSALAVSLTIISFSKYKKTKIAK